MDKNNDKSAASEGEDPAFDEWLHRSLTDLYAPVLEEPIPDDLAEIIKKHRQKQ